MPSVSAITDLVKRASHDAGFELAGIAPVREFDELAYFPQWIDAGHAGEMKYLASPRRHQAVSSANPPRGRPLGA